MGKRITQQRRGSGSPSYRSPSHRYKVDLAYRTYDDMEKAGVLRGQVMEFVDDPSRDSLLMRVKYENEEWAYLLAPEGIAIGDYIDSGAQARLTMGSVMPLYRIPDGAYIFNIEHNPGDGGKMVKAAGSYATLISKEEGRAYIKLPSRKVVTISTECRAQLGIIAGGGRLEKPLLKAGNAFYKYNARNRLWPVVRGVHMAAYNHPHGGKQHHVGKSSIVARSAPPGAKVGHLAARSTGRKKAKRAGDKIEGA
ncbi:MAG TPA: 50S ribosomal protein L2 [Candidatus Bilamarchaeaceae archaeon]|nr:50S ribosomal protein L2 [Candidatus Bilamarchaeaceae archaeon]